MSPASYRAAPPRVGMSLVYGHRRGDPNRRWFVVFGAGIRCRPEHEPGVGSVGGGQPVGVALGVAVAVALGVAPGVSVTLPDGAAAAASAMAALSRACASPYFVKSPALSAASASLTACWASARALIRAGLSAVAAVPVGGGVGVPVPPVVGVLSPDLAPELPPNRASSAPSRVEDHASLSPNAVMMARLSG